MSDNAASFVGNIPEHYDRGLGPVFFADFAEETAKRVAAFAPQRVLETSAGTGIVSRRLRDLLSSGARLTVTDLNPPMLEVARAKFKPGETVEFEPADATDLPFPDRSVVALVCQFGSMFFPDKEKSYREAYRVLKPGGHYLFSVWDAHRFNPAPDAGRDGVLFVGRITPHKGVDRLIAAAIVQVSIESQTAEAGLSQLAVLESGVFDDRDKSRAQETKPVAYGDRCGEARRIAGEAARRYVQPLAEKGRHVRIAHVGDRTVVTAQPAQQRSRAAVPVDDEPAYDHVGARRHMALQPIGGARPGDIPTVAPFRDDALEPVLGDHFQERLAVVVEVLGHGEKSRPQAEALQTCPALGERPRDERTTGRVQEIERDEDRAAAALRRFGSETTREKVVARTTARVAYDDLAVEHRSRWDAEVAELRDGGKEVATGAVGHAKTARVVRGKRAEPVPLQLEDVFG